MTEQHEKPSFLEHYLEKHTFNLESKGKKQVKLAICLGLFIVTIFMQGVVNPDLHLNGLLSQGQVALSVYMVVGIGRSGYRAAVNLNLLACLYTGIYMIRSKDWHAIPGVIIPLITIGIVMIIHIFAARLNKRLREISSQHRRMEIINQELIRNETHLNYLAYFDPLTELPNRKMIINRLENLLIANESQNSFAVAFIDLDNFKRINDTMGHYAGDLLLQATAERLKAFIPKEDLLGRLGGDEFALIILHTTDFNTLKNYVEHLRIILMEPFLIEQTQVVISASIGVAIHPEDGHDAMELLKYADTAMYKAKENGKNGISFFKTEMRDEVELRSNMENFLFTAVKKHEMFLLYQPQVYAKSGNLRGFEVLARWKSPELGLVLPEDFIAVAEENGYMVPLGEWVLREACERMQAHFSQSMEGLILAVNISSVQLMAPNFTQMVKVILEETQFPVKNLEIEITESVFIGSMEQTVDVLKELKALGLRIALDDFGTGYSSLNYIQQLPLDLLKIDKSFIEHIWSNHTKHLLVGSMIGLVHQLGIEVVAEGVENQWQLNYLRQHHCDILQGFMFGAPMTEEEMIQLMEESHVLKVL